MIDIFAILAALGQSDTATVEAFLYTTSDGTEHYGAATPVPCFRDAKRRIVMDTSTGKGSQVTSDTTVYLPLGTVCPVHSRVTLTDGAGSREAMQVLERNGTGLPTPDHLEVLLV